MDMAPAAFADRILETAGIGGWEFDVLAGRLLWSALTFRIHEVDPSAQPDLEGALDFYAPEARPVIAKAVQDAIDGGTPWNLELPFITARGRRLWVRACGQAVRAGGRTVKLVGAFEDITERRDLAERAGRLSVVARQMTNAVIMTDADGLTLWVNDAFCRLTGFTIAEVRGRKPGAFLQGPATDPATVRHMAACLARGEGFEVEIVNYNKLRVPYCMAVTCTALRDEAGALTGFIAVESDITARRAAEEEVRRQSAERHRAEALLRDVLEALPSAVTAYDSHERLILTNRSYAAMFPIAAQFATPGRRLEEIIRKAAEAGQYSACGAAGEEREAWVAETLRQTRQTGITHTLALSGGRFVLARESRSETGNLVCVRTDTTELQQAEAALRTLAEQDSLTGLANRACLLAALERQLGRAVADDGAGGALLLFDVDHFKQINDTLGHDAGDGVLVELAGRLRAHIRGGDVAARLGGDEFAVLLPGLRDAAIVAERVTDIQNVLALPMVVSGRQLSITISGGATLYPADAADVASLLKNADLAMYEAKRNGRARWCAFHPEQAAALARHSLVAHALRQALAAGALTVAFQPKRTMAGAHAGFEALARWHDGARWVPPNDFIPVAEAAGLMEKLGCVVFDLALARLRTLRDGGHAPGRVAVNVTSAQLLNGDFVSMIGTMLARQDLTPADLELEMTETVLHGRAAGRVGQALHALRALGIGLALDDFGSGLASLSHLATLPIDRIKIDRSFIGAIGVGARSGVIARTVIGLARTLGLESVAEGVETQEQFAFLKDAGCDVVQGYLVAPPLLALEEAEAYLRGCRKGILSCEITARRF